jgi:atypical dual specificity phosphatase
VSGSEVLIRFRAFGVSFGEQVVLADVTFDIPRIGLTVLVGPAGSGKSTLVRTIAGLNESHPSLSTWGAALFDGSPLRLVRPAAPGEVRRGVGFVMQHARFFVDSVRENLVSALPDRSRMERRAQTRHVTALLAHHNLGELERRLDEDVTGLSTQLQRRLAVVRALVSEPSILVADEPTAGLDESEAIDLLAMLRVQARERAVLFVTHHQRFAQIAGGTTVLLASGRVQETAPTAVFFRSPRTEAGQGFVRTGGCPSPSPVAHTEDLESSAPPPASLPVEAMARSRFEGPRGFFWVWPGRLGGLPRPGIVEPAQEDLAALKRLGVTTMVTLEETPTIAGPALEHAEMSSIHFPIIDMGVPAVADAEVFCRDLHARIEAGEVVALHCRAGLGRTGTMLAAMLVYAGEPARAAIERVRRLNPRSIQSGAQVEFLSVFEGSLRGRGLTAAASATQMSPAVET